MPTRRLCLLPPALAVAVILTAATWFALTHVAGPAAAEVGVNKRHVTTTTTMVTTTPKTARRHTSPARVPARRAVIAPAQKTPAPPTRSIAAVPAPAAPAPKPRELPLPSSGVLATPTPPPDPHAHVPVIPTGGLRIPKIGLTAPICEGISLTVLNRCPGHWPGTAVPGAWGNVVIAGHRTTFSHPFLNIDLLAPGDQIIFDRADGSQAVYVTTGTEIVPPTAMWIVRQTPGTTVTLFACHPKGSAAQRIVVHGRLAELRKL